MIRDYKQEIVDEKKNKESIDLLAATRIFQHKENKILRAKKLITFHIIKNLGNKSSNRFKIFSRFVL